MIECSKTFKPPPKLTVSEWSDLNRILSPEASAEPGKWRTDRAEYQRGIMDVFSDRKVKELVIMTSAQVGKTEIVLNTVGFHIDQDPSPILVVQPTIEMGKTWSKDRFAPMVRDTRCLKGKLKDPRTRDSENTILHKVFEGGHITVAGANSPASLSSRPVRLVICEEVDRFPISCGTEGDPVKLAYKRTTAFWNAKKVSISTPTVKGLSRVESAFEGSDQRRFYVPCRYCREFQTLKWRNVVWKKGKPKTAHYVCEFCQAELLDSDKAYMIRRGEWRPENEFDGVAGFHINELYNPWVSFSKLVTEFLDAKRDRETLRVWINTSLGETWEEEEGEELDSSQVKKRCEKYSAEIPKDALVLTAGVDVQVDRLEIEVVAWGRNEESWSIEYEVFHGDPVQGDVWNELDLYLQKTFEHESGVKLGIRCCCIDSGYATQIVYKWVKPRQIKRVFATKGFPGAGRPIVAKFSTSNKERIKLFPLGVDTAKDVIYGRLKKEEPGYGYMHFPIKPEYDEEFFNQLTAEKVITKMRRGIAYREWKKIRARNEVLDARIYAYAAMIILNPNFNLLEEDLKIKKKKLEEEEKKEETKKQNHKAKKRRGFVHRWRR